MRRRRSVATRCVGQERVSCPTLNFSRARQSAHPSVILPGRLHFDQWDIMLHVGQERKLLPRQSNNKANHP